MDAEAFDNPGVELVDLDEKRVFFDDVPSVSLPLHAEKKPKVCSESEIQTLFYMSSIHIFESFQNQTPSEF